MLTFNNYIVLQIFPNIGNVFFFKFHILNLHNTDLQSFDMCSQMKTYNRNYL